MKENLIERGKSFIINLSQQVENDIAAFNFSGVMEVVKENVKNNKEIKYAILMDSHPAKLLFIPKDRILCKPCWLVPMIEKHSIRRN